MKTKKREEADKYCPEKHGALLSAKQAAAIVSASEKTLATWRSEGTGPTYLKRIGRVYYPEILVRMWVDANSVLVIAKQ